MRTEEETKVLYDKYYKYVTITVKNNFTSPKFMDNHLLSLDDIYQFARIGLYKGCQTFDESKGKVTSYLINMIKWEVIRCCKLYSLRNVDKETLDTYGIVSLDRVLSDDDDLNEETLYHYICDNRDYFEDTRDKEFMESLSFKLSEKASPRVAEIISYVTEGYNHTEIANMLGITRQAVGANIKRYKPLIAEIVGYKGCAS